MGQVLVDYHVHGIGHRTNKHTAPELAKYIEQGIAQNLTEIGFADHDEYLLELDFSSFLYLQRRYPQIRLRLGLEVDYRPGQEKILGQRLAPYQFDYLIGSIHFIGDWPFDHPAYTAGYAAWDIDELHQTYFSLVTQMVRSGQFDIVGHLDLIKVFGYRPRRSVLDLAGSTLSAIQESGMTVEINTAGWYKPVAEVYPGRDLLEECFRLGIPITLSSDAHAAQDVGRDIARAREMAWAVGYRQVAVFEKRQRSLLPL
ncbi:MAG: histidinol-phosphatase HisJ family protein [Syntrophomonadaceae bacterium]|nr:histidinol-phosphatase HisJ family protein [Syntrophomonadaceae bacterium]